VDAGSTRPLHTGRGMPVLGLGTWQLTDDTAGTVAEALRLGYRMIDTSGDYGTQAGVGEATRRSGLDRDEIFVVTKVEEHEDAYEAARHNVHELGLDHADLILIHRPPPGGPGHELWLGLMRAKEEGLARDIGVSNYSAGQIQELAEVTGESPAVNQIEWSPFGWSRQMLDYCRERRIEIQAYSPLTRTRRLDDERLAELAAEYDRTPAQILLRWDLQLGVVPLPKANRREHLEENLGVFDFALGEEHVAELGQLNEHYSSLGRLAYV
jgi:diketogulonate reductase-like aldo/keto reductase